MQNIGVSLSFFLYFISALSYNIALCHYSLKNYAQAIKNIEEIIERGIREHPGKTTTQWNCHNFCCIDFYLLVVHYLN